MPEDKTTRFSQPKTHHEPWGAPCAALMEGNREAVARWMSVLLALSQEVAQFTQARLQEDAAAWSALAACRTPDEAMECQRRFAATASEQYWGEINKLSQMVLRTASERLSAPSTNA